MSPAVELASTMWSIVRSIILKKNQKMHSTGAHYFRYARDRKLKAQSLVYINFRESLGFYQEGAMRIARSHFVCGSPVSDNLTL